MVTGVGLDGSRSRTRAAGYHWEYQSKALGGSFVVSGRVVGEVGTEDGNALGCFNVSERLAVRLARRR